MLRVFEPTGPPNALPTKRLVLWLWYVAVPVATALCGYFPGKRLRKVGDLPAGVIAQWRRWCLSPDYVGSEGREARAAYASVRVVRYCLPRFRCASTAMAFHCSHV